MKAQSRQAFGAGFRTRAASGEAEALLGGELHLDEARRYGVVDKIIQ